MKNICDLRKKNIKKIPFVKASIAQNLSKEAEEKIVEKVKELFLT